MEYTIWIFILLVIVGLTFGLIAIMVGIGGGLMNVPFLIYVMKQSPETAGFISSFIIMFTSFSGFMKYRSLKRIDYSTARKFLMLAIPGSIIGGYLASTIDPAIIKIIFSIIIGLAGIRGISKALSDSTGKIISDEDGEAQGLEKRSIVDSDGDVTEYYVRMNIGMPFAFLGGLLAGLLGVGGGIIYMPLMLSITGVPIHLAVPTSATMIVVVSIFAVISRIVTLSSTGTLDLSVLPLYGIPLALGSIIGARFGAGRLKRTKSKTLLVSFWGVAVISAFRMGFGI